jgi:hypothetical protein
LTASITEASRPPESQLSAQRGSQKASGSRFALRLVLLYQRLLAVFPTVKIVLQQVDELG